MLEEIIVQVQNDHPGVLAEIGEVLGANQVNIETLAASNFTGIGLVHLVVDDGEDAAEVLRSNGYEVKQVRNVMSVTLDDRPGEFGAYCRRLAEAGIDVSAVYVAHKGGGETELVFAVDDIEAAKKA